MPVIHLTAASPDGSRTIETAALLDQCANRTLCTPSLLRKLRLPSRDAPMALDLAGKPKHRVDARSTSMDVISADNRVRITLPCVYAIPGLPTRLEYAREGDATGYPHLSELPLPTGGYREVELIIGLDSHRALRPTALALGEPDEPYAFRTPLGWAIAGRVPDRAACFLALAPADELLERVDKFWALESSGLYDDARAPSVNDERVRALWEGELEKVNGRYQLPIPFRQGQPQLPDSERHAIKRLQHLSRRLQHDESLARQYAEGIRRLIDQGYAEIAPERRSADADVWYVPHHAVVHPRKGKVRIVFDCAAKVAGTSLNSVVHTGPDLANSLVGVLLRFRQYKVAVTADVEAMFHQVKVPPRQRDVLRFLWYPDGDATQPPVAYRMTSHLFGGTWSPSACMFALRRTAEDYGNGYHPQTVRTLERHFYVDDCLRSVATTDEARRLTEQLPQLAAEGGFRLTKWISNDARALESVREEDKVSTPQQRVPGAPADDAVLGVYWDTEDDCFCFSANLPNHHRTRRGLLSALSSVYDPLGLLGPFILEARRIVQDLCRLNLRWDDPIPEDAERRWETWTRALDSVPALKFPRCLLPHQPSAPPVLHHFSDASGMAYGVTSYLRYTDHHGQHHATLVMAKSRLSPMKATTIPRLELCAATLATRQDELLRRELDLSLGQSVFWVDSTTVLQYIFSTNRRFLTFVANRVGEIRRRTSLSAWRYVPTADNPADITTRPTDPRTLGYKHWQQGPEFLRLSPESWPDNAVPPPLGEEDNEVSPPATCCLQETRRRLDFMDSFVERYSWTKKIRILARAVAAIHYAAGRGPHPRELQPWHTTHAERLIWEHAQEKCYGEEISAIEEGRPLPRNSPLRRLSPVLREGTLYSEGRLRNADIPPAAKTPIILPGRHPAVRALLLHVHESNGHCGYRQMIVETWEQYWIVSATVVAKAIVRRCVTCRRRDAQPAKQRMADLPADRVTKGTAAFTNVGLDYFGPMLVKVGRRQEKRYGCLFTCLKTRAVHVEVAHSLDTQAFLMALERFISRRGLPEIIRSDNGRNFTGGERELRRHLEGWNQERINNALAPRKIEWLFNPPFASHMGGVWERQIRTLRRLFAGLTGRQQLTDEALHTLLVTAEGIVNNRPLAEIPGEVGEIGALTPNHLLMLRTADRPALRRERDAPPVRQRWRQVQQLADTFWRRWTKEYLPLLRSRTKWQDDKPNVGVGDLVIITDADTPRDTWPLARVDETLPGPDGRVRMARVRTARGRLLRPIVKLVVLEEAAQREPDPRQARPRTCHGGGAAQQ